MDLVTYSAPSDRSEPILGLLIGIPLSLAIWAAVAVLAFFLL